MYKHSKITNYKKSRKEIKLQIVKDILKIIKKLTEIYVEFITRTNVVNSIKLSMRECARITLKLDIR